MSCNILSKGRRLGKCNFDGSLLWRLLPSPRHHHLHVRFLYFCPHIRFVWLHVRFFSSTILTFSPSYNSLWFAFVTDGSVQNRGFELTYTTSEVDRDWCFTLQYISPPSQKTKIMGWNMKNFVEMHLQLLLWFEGVQRKWRHLEGYGGSDKLPPAGIKIRAWVFVDRICIFQHYVFWVFEQE